MVAKAKESCGYTLCRTKSFRVEKSSNYRIFRATDLVQGKLLGRGFFGEVFLVTHKETGEKMVLKELYRVDEEAQLNFLREAAFLRSLNHPNVLRFIGVLYKDKKLHILTEYISGGTLRELIQDLNQPLSWERKVNIGKDISAGMTYLHSMQIIHRDLNSQNCLVKANGTVVVADFGLARMMISSNRRMSNGSSTSTSGVPVCAANGGNGGASGIGGGSGKKKDRRKRYTVVGNPYWMAPEMMKGKEYDEKVDLFSFGIILCEIIGRIQADPDYMPRNGDFGLNRIIFREKYCGSCPEAFWRIAFLCTEIDPDRRPSFRLLDKWLQSMSTHWRMSHTLHIPNELLTEISTFSGMQRRFLEDNDSE